jgi:hypothetical protein
MKDIQVSCTRNAKNRGRYPVLITLRTGAGTLY